MSRPLRVSTGTPVVIDSSVAFKWFDATEDGAAEALDLLRAHQRDEIELVAPAHLTLEVVNVLVSRKASPDELERGIRFLADTDLLIAPVEEWLVVEAARVATSEHITLYDAVFVALAAALDAELVTADRQQGSTTACRVRLIGEEDRRRSIQKATVGMREIAKHVPAGLDTTQIIREDRDSDHGRRAPHGK